MDEQEKREHMSRMGKLWALWISVFLAFEAYAIAKGGGILSAFIRRFFPHLGQDAAALELAQGAVAAELDSRVNPDTGDKRGDAAWEALKARKDAVATERGQDARRRGSVNV